MILIVIPAGRKPALHSAGGPGRQTCGDPGSIMMDPPLTSAGDDDFAGVRGGDVVTYS